MDRLIFSSMVHSSDSCREALILAASIRKFGGRLSDTPIWVLIPEANKDILTLDVEEQLIFLDVKIIPFPDDSEVRKFPFARYVYAAATAESLSNEKTEILAWMCSDTIVIREPQHFLLEMGKNIGYRPVHHLVKSPTFKSGSIYEEPIDPFWELVYSECNVPESKIFPMKTHVDHYILRAYFNAGLVVIRPEMLLLQSWWKKFKELYNEPSFKEFFEKDDLYSIFFHQAVLTGVILSTVEEFELLELPFSYNYPLNLFFETPVEYHPREVNDLITARYEDISVLKAIPFRDPFQSWIKDHL
ncbi:MAG: hypothetical protein JSV04_14615 [Candidatus Heimdallarchaeota archaeon]|nr:MAG: hypothetical protein JSV04_14615 [Candidatus Heimdallarchaeota archaeon]